MDIILKIFTIFILCIPFSPSFVLSSRLRVYGGDTAEPGQFPFMVSVNVKGFGHWSGGSIINKNWIVTAAHSMADWFPENLTVLTGTTLLDTGGTSYSASTIIIHSEYNDTIMTNDIALLKIDGTFDFDDLVRTVEIGAVLPNESATVIGWGSTEQEESPNELHYVTLTALSDDDCTELSQGGEYVLDRGPGQVCAMGTEGKGGCYGDSGGPLVSNTGALVGIVSYGVKACAKGYPDVYTRVAYYTDWIDKHIARD